jgi:hypothetical protein
MMRLLSSGLLYGAIDEFGCEAADALAGDAGNVIKDTLA